MPAIMMQPPHLPPQLQERVVCSIAAAAKYEIPADVLLAVAEKEGGRPGQWVLNTNGTHDVGVMQFNTAYLRVLERYGIRPEHVAAQGCYPYQLAAWRLRMHIKQDSGDLWTKAANYHSRTPRFNAVYRADLIGRAQKWGQWLRANYPDVQPLVVNLERVSMDAGPSWLTEPRSVRSTSAPETSTRHLAPVAKPTAARTSSSQGDRFRPDVPRGLLP